MGHVGDGGCNRSPVCHSESRFIGAKNLGEGWYLRRPNRSACHPLRGGREADVVIPWSGRTFLQAFWGGCHPRPLPNLSLGDILCFSVWKGWINLCEGLCPSHYPWVTWVTGVTTLVLFVILSPDLSGRRIWGRGEIFTACRPLRGGRQADVVIPWSGRTFLKAVFL